MQNIFFIAGKLYRECITIYHKKVFLTSSLPVHTPCPLLIFLPSELFSVGFNYCYLLVLGLLNMGVLITWPHPSLSSFEFHRADGDSSRTLCAGAEISVSLHAWFTW